MAPDGRGVATAPHFFAMGSPMLLSFRRPLLAALLSLPLAAAPLPGPRGSAQAQAVTYVGGTGVGIVPPKGMTPSKAFAGFEMRETGASILVAEFPPEAYAQIVSTFTVEGIAASGVQASGAAIDWKVAGGTGGRLIRGKQTAQGTVFRKWILLAKGPATTVMLSVQVPDGKAGSLTDAAVDSALKTVTLKAPPSLDEQAGLLPFRVGDRVGFRLVRVLGGSGLMFTDGPRDTIPDASQPVVVVASSITPVTATTKDEREELAAKSFDSITGVSDSSIVSRKTEEKDGVTWSRIEGRGTYRDSLEAISVLQLMRFEKTGYVRVVAITRSLDRDRILPRVDALAASISPK